MVLVQKRPFFQLCFVRQYRPGKCLLRYSRTKERLSRVQKQEVKKVEICLFSKGVDPWFLSKNGYFSNFPFLCNICQKTIFYHILGWKNAFLGYKNKKLKKSRHWHFSKKVNPWFCFKNGHFSNYFFKAI